MNPLTYGAVLGPDMNDSILHVDYLRDGGCGGGSSDNPRALFDDGGIAARFAIQLDRQIAVPDVAVHAAAS